jgi:cytochrome c-type biogenesis protein
MSLTLGPASSSPGDINRRSRRDLRGGTFAVAAGASLLVVAFALGLYFLPRFQAAHPPTALQRSDANRTQLDDLYLDLTLATPSFVESRRLGRYLGDRDPRLVLPILVGLNTHTGTIEHLHHLPGGVTLIGPDERRYPAISEPIVLSQHHNAYLLLFPASDHRGEAFLGLEEGALAVEASDFGRQSLRRFEWQLPIVDPPGSGASWTTRLTLLLALSSALLIVLSPCALELSLYYAAIVSCTITEGEREADHSASDPLEVGRRRVWLNLASFVVGFTLLYAVAGATVGLLGEGVRRPLGEYGEWLPRLGGLLIVLFAIRVSGLSAWLDRARAHRPHPGNAAKAGVVATTNRWQQLYSLPRRTLAGLRYRGRDRVRAGCGMRARDSFLVGLGLSSACLTCMGGAVLYPLLVYAGITSWFSGLVTLTLYSLAIALPMLAIALGFVRIRMSLRRRWGLSQALRWASAALLFSIGLILALGYERIITDVTFRTMAEVARWSA